MTALEKLISLNESGKYICVGLDTDINKVPAHLRDKTNPALFFNEQIIEATHKEAAAYKLNFAFYERYGASGMETLKKTIELIPHELLIIGDAKRGDISNTSTMYAQSVFDLFGCDAVTVNPYMGGDSVKPFLDFKDKLIFILVLTSNPGADDFEKLKLSDGSYLFQEVIKKIHEWDKGTCSIVFGATKPEELKENLNLIGDLPILLPGVGAQGGSLEDVVRILSLRKVNRFLVNVSRGVIYKSTGKDFAAEAGNELMRLNSIVKLNLKNK